MCSLGICVEAVGYIGLAIFDGGYRLASLRGQLLGAKPAPRTECSSHLTIAQHACLLVLSVSTVAQCLLSRALCGDDDPIIRISLETLLWGSLIWFNIFVRRLTSGGKSCPIYRFPLSWYITFSAVSVCANCIIQSTWSAESTLLSVMRLLCASFLALTCDDRVRISPVPDDEQQPLFSPTDDETVVDTHTADHVAQWACLKALRPCFQLNTRSRQQLLCKVLTGRCARSIEGTVLPLLVRRCLEALQTMEIDPSGEVRSWMKPFGILISCWLVLRVATVAATNAQSALETDFEAEITTFPGQAALTLPQDFYRGHTPAEIKSAIDKGTGVVELLFMITLEIPTTSVGLVAILVTVGHVFNAEVPFVIVLMFICRAGILQQAQARVNYILYTTNWYRADSQWSEVLSSHVAIYDQTGTEHEKTRHRLTTSSVATSYKEVLFRREFWAYIKHFLLVASYEAVVVMDRLAMTSSKFVLLYAYWNAITRPFEELTSSLEQVGEKMVDVDKAFRFLTRALSPPERPREQRYIGSKGGIRVRFNNVEFQYSADQQVLRDISFEATPGQMVALVGASGSGKSTVLQLLKAAYDPTQGTITVNNQDLVNLDRETYLEHVAVASQNPDLFTGSVAYNVDYPRFTADDAQVREACIKAECVELVTAGRNEYKETLTGAGDNLSGGQKQRLALARMFMKKNVSMLLLDETTSHLDAMTEQRVMASIKDHARGKTCFIAAHRLSTIQDADQILVFDKGRIVESGKHEDLMDACGVYYNMWTTSPLRS